MTPEALWNEYAATWSLPADERDRRLPECVVDEATYCDPNGLIEGRAALSDYMAEFQRSVPGGRFQIRSVVHHHDRSLAHWALCASDGNPLRTGVSFAALAMDGRLGSITGFFDPAKTALPT
jgi:ketosteroid isomerase-like protein